MDDRHDRAVAIVGVAAILPDAGDARTFRDNVWNKRYSVTDVPSDRWSVADYYDSDPAAPDKTYTRIGAWVRGFEFDWRRFHVPPRVAAAMDEGQQWALTAAADALADYGFPARGLDLERTGVILGTAMGGERHYLTSLRIAFPEYARALGGVREFLDLPDAVRGAILSRWREVVARTLPAITEDSMPGELPNVLSGRVANVLNLRGPNFVTDAACASSMAALDAAIEALVDRQCDAVVTGGVDRNMGVSSFVKFCKIGALSATGTRPFGDGADGFVMGEGCAAFVVKRLVDAERDGDRIYAVVRGVGAASDGKGKGITAPNPIGQQLAMRRAWDDAGLDPATCTLIEAHGTSTRVGDVVEVESLSEVFRGAGRQQIALGSVKSNVGHLKAAAGAAGLLKVIWALHEKTLPPTLHASPPNPNIDFASSPFVLNHDLREWRPADGVPRRAGVSAYGFGGTNFHVVLEEHVPGASHPRSVPVPGIPSAEPPTVDHRRPAVGAGPDRGKQPLRGILAIGASTTADLKEKLDVLVSRVQGGFLPPVAPPSPAELASQERLIVDYADPPELLDRLAKARKAFALDTPAAWRTVQAQGVFRGRGRRCGKLAFLFPGQGSQWVNMGRRLAEREPAAREVFAEADRVMEPLVGRPLTHYVFVDGDDPQAVKEAEQALTQTSITQPAVLCVDTAIARLLGEHGFQADALMGHSLGEYAALVAADVLPFADAIEAAAARGREMTRVSVEDAGWMAAVMAPLPVVEETLSSIDGYVVAANINSRAQCVIGGATAAVQAAMAEFQRRGFQAVRLPVSHAFHTRIVAPAGGPLRSVLDRLRVSEPRRPLVSNVTGDFYPSSIEAIKDLLERQIASPVRWADGLLTLYEAGVRTFVEVGPKRALKAFVDDVLGERGDVVSLFTNHPKPGELETFNQALCGLLAAGHGAPPRAELAVSTTAGVAEPPAPLHVPRRSPAAQPSPEGEPAMNPSRPSPPPGNGGDSAASPADSAETLARLLAQALQRTVAPERTVGYDRNRPPLGSVVITGTGLGLPGAEKPVMDPGNVERILRGEQLVDLIPERFRRLMTAKRVTRVVKGEDGSGRFETLADSSEAIKLAGRAGAFDLAAEYGVPDKLVDALDSTSQLAMAAGLDALREAGIPLVQTYRRTRTGRALPDRWMLPEPLRDETGVVFASAFPGLDRFADELERYYADDSRRARRDLLEELRAYTKDPETLREIRRRAAELDEQLAREPYGLDRRFLLRVLPMGHSQFAEYVGARGPNCHLNSACASTAHAIALAEDWIQAGRCRRVVVIGGDNPTSPHLMEWMGAGFLAVGAAATDDKVEEAALPFDRRRHGMLVGMGACALVVESQDAVEERGMRGIVELLSSEARNSAFHATRLDVDHIAGVMESLLSSAESRFGLDRRAMAPDTVFVSHETYTPARGGSAAAEVHALRRTFGPAANEIVIANTKGFTGHPMGVGVEDVIAVKILEHGIVPPVPNFREVDPELGLLNLSRGGRYPVTYAIHLAAGFGSEIALTLTRRIPGGLDRVDAPAVNRRWLCDVTGHERAETEVVRRVLRVKAEAAPPHAARANAWTWGTGPVRRAPGAEPGPIAGRPAQRATFTVEERVAVAVPPPSTTVIPAAPSTPPVAPASPPSAITPAAPPMPADEVTARVLAIVAGKTGYPPEMLDLELDLEADLGVDTVKQAETFAAVREAYDIPRQDDLRLRDFPTLQHVVQFVLDRRPDLARPATGAAEQPAAEPIGRGPEASAPAPAAPDAVTARVLAIVAEKTGYPPEMLDLELDMEADLGVDTVKQAETFAAVREAYDIPRQDDLRLRDFPTLRHVVQFVLDRRPDLGPKALAEVAAAPVSATATTAQQPAADPDRFPRRVPVPVLRPALDLCKPTGVALGAGARVVVGADEGGVAAALSEQLESRGVAVLPLAPAASGDELRSQLETFLADGAIQGVFWLPALDVEASVEEMDLESFRDAARRRVKNLSCAMRALYDSIAGPGTFLVAATRMGGLLGHDAEGATAPLGGAVAGFAKAYKHERPEATVKVVDFGAAAASSEIAGALVAEALGDPAVVEVGCRDHLRWTIALEEDGRSAGNGQAGPTMGRDTVFLVTGSAGGITSAIVSDLASCGGTFYLLDVVPEPAGDDRRVALLRTGREELKRTLIEEAVARGERPTPAAIEREILAAERAEAVRRCVDSIEAAGGHALYRRADLRDGGAVAMVVDEARTAHGRIDVLVHAAGIEISRKLPDKEPAEFDRVFDIKADGFFNLLRAARGMPLGATVAFSSIAGRFGNAGQTDYSAANALLCSLTSHLRRLRPETRAVAIDWTAWAEVGMATRGSIPAVMASAGIETLPPQVGLAAVRRELAAPGASGEVVVAGRLGALAADWDEAGGLAVDALQQRLRERAHPFVMMGAPRSASPGQGLVVETTLDPAEQPFLFDHQMDGTPLLPGVMGTEAFAELASVLCPAHHVAAVEDEEFLVPFKFHRMQPATLRLVATGRRGGDDEVLVGAELRSIVQPRPELPAQEKLHFRATVRMSRRPAAARTVDFERPSPASLTIDRDRLYSVYFHGPSYRVLDGVELADGRAVGVMAAGLPPDVAPADAEKVIDPRMIELCFQTAGAWLLARKETMALPSRVDSISVPDPPPAPPGRSLFALVDALGGGEAFDAKVVDDQGRVYLELSGYRTVPLPERRTLGS